MKETTKESLKESLRKHGLWLQDKGSRFCLKDLQGADLRGADLSHADLQDADLRGANLTHNAAVIYACSGKYQMTLIKGPTPMIHSGCRWFTIPEAQEHWKEGNEEQWTVTTQAYGILQRDMLEFLVKHSE